MAEYTENLNLKKPAQADRFSIADYNVNLDKLDAAIGNVRLVLVSSEEYAASTSSPDILYIVSYPDGSVRQYLGDIPVSGGAAFIIENAAVLTADEGQELTAEQEIVNVDTASRTTTVYGNPKNTVIVGGNRWLFCADTAELKLRASPEDAVTDAEFYINDTAYSYMTRLSSMAKTAEGFSWTVGLWRRKSGSTDSWGNIANLTVTEEPASFGIVCRAQSMSESTTYYKTGSGTYQTPNGYMLGRMNIAAFSADGSVIAVSEITSNGVSWQRFSSAAERDYAFAVTTRSEISEVTENV